MRLREAKSCLGNAMDDPLRLAVQIVEDAVRQNALLKETGSKGYARAILPAPNANAIKDWWKVQPLARLDRTGHEFVTLFVTPQDAVLDLTGNKFREKYE